MRVKPSVGKQSVPIGEKPTVHNVFILDRSGSMSGPKYRNAEKGINVELNELKKSEDVNFTQTIVEFDYSGNYVTHCFMQPIKSVNEFVGRGARGSTALYEAVGVTINKILENKPNKEDKVLIKIFTDGEENDSSSAWRSGIALRDLIKSVEKNEGFTVTFEGTADDTEEIIRVLGVDRSNTNIHDNTAESIFKNALTRSAATITYSKAVADGEDVTRGFYTKSKE